MKKVLALVSGILAAAAGAAAQATQSTEKPQPIVRERVLMGSQATENAVFLLTEMDGLGKVVKNAPYTATAVTETTQTLADGNRIVNKTTAFLARDSAGRMRREENIAKVGNLPASASKAIIIKDPVGEFEYLVQPGIAPDEADPGNSAELKKKGLTLTHVTAGGPRITTFELSQSGATGKIALGGPNDHGTKTWISDVTTEKIRPGERQPDEADVNVKHESLGVQAIQGVPAEGVRDTRTIPAGAIGNEKPIVITSEVWTSTELQVVVLSKRNDPRFGETVYTLTDITRGEPDPALFQPPDKVKTVVPPSK